MDWVETTGKSVDEATDRALAHLGVHRDDAEIEVLEEPKAGLFGRIRGEARVRARVRPASLRPKRSRRSGGREDRGRGEARERNGSRTKSNKPRELGRDGGVAALANDRPATESAVEKSPRSPKSNQKAPQSSRGPRPERAETNLVKENNMAEGISLEEQGAIAKSFLEGFLTALNLVAEVTVREIDSETVELAVNANPPSELGVLVGPRGSTLQALQEITRTVVQAKSPGRTDRILVDVAQYRERRVAALGRFAAQVAGEVVATGEERALEPMSAADRKAVHDSLTENDAVTTRSEGEEPRRFVVIAPA